MFRQDKYQMLLEFLLILGTIGLILLFFYKQAVQEFRILQTDSLDKAMPLLQERCPLVVLPAPQPQQLWTRQDISQRPTLSAFPVNGKPLKEAIQFDSYPLIPTTAETLAKQIGLSVWIHQTLTPTFTQASWWTPILFNRTEVAIGAQGLRQTTAYSTGVMVTDGAILVSLLNESSDPYLPASWKGKRLSKLTRDDAPLLAQIQYVDVIVRPGSMLLVPPHWKICWETLEGEKAPALAVWTEFHHSISNLARKMQK
jgi:hypothetical protein